jgi:hypothetical protein
MAIDIIYLIILTPAVVLVSFAVYAVKQRNKRIMAKPEAKPYVYERDAHQPNFDEFSKAIFNHKFYKGKAK